MIMIYDMVLMTSRRGMIIHILLYDNSHDGFYPSFVGFTNVISSFAGFTRVIR